MATPIGNAGDLSLRALRVLESVDAIACEDTRVTARLLAIHGISRPLRRYDEHTADKAGPALLERIARRRAHRAGQRRRHAAGLRSGRAAGARLHRCRPAAHRGARPVGAADRAQPVAGLPTGRFLFAGYLAARPTARRRELAELADVAATLVLLESPQRLAAALADMADVLGARDAAVARELTKLFEEVRRGPLAALAAHYAAEGAPKGEVTIVVAPPPPLPPVGDDEAARLLAEALASLSAARRGGERRPGDRASPPRSLCACHRAEGRGAMRGVGAARQRRRLAWRFGRLGEALCAWRLRLCGWRLLARDVRTPVGELDLVVRRGRMLAFVEVKARSDAGVNEPLTAHQRRRIVRAAAAYLAARPDLARLDIRFDVMLVGRARLPRHLPAAFRADDRTGDLGT